MSQNTYKIKHSNAVGKSFFTFIEQMLKLDVLFEEGIPSKYIPHAVFISFLGIFYIGNTHYAEKNIRQIETLEVEVEELRADYTSLKADYMFSSKQSEVAKKVESIGLKESKTPPEKIVIKKGEY